jgi:uncharacterized membrane protein YfcA
MQVEMIILFLLLALVAEVLGTVGGFGSSLFFVPLAGYFLDFHSVLGITGVFHVASNLSKIILFKKGVDKKLLLTMGIPALFFVGLGALLSKYINVSVAEMIMACFLIILSSTLLIKEITIKPTLTNAISGGILSGFLAGLIGTGGAIRGLTLTAFNLEQQAFIATSAIIDLGVDGTRSIIYAFNGYVHLHDLYLILLLFIVSFIGTWIGKILLNHVSEKIFKRIVLTLILITGIIGLIKFF